VCSATSLPGHDAGEGGGALCFWERGGGWPGGRGEGRRQSGKATEPAPKGRWATLAYPCMFPTVMLRGPPFPLDVDGSPGNAARDKKREEKSIARSARLHTLSISRLGTADHRYLTRAGSETERSGDGPAWLPSGRARSHRAPSAIGYRGIAHPRVSLLCRRLRKGYSRSLPIDGARPNGLVSAVGGGII